MFQMIANFCGTVTCKNRGLQFMGICEMCYWLASPTNRIYYVGHFTILRPYCEAFVVAS
jgi:hypothetical protein